MFKENDVRFKELIGKNYTEPPHPDMPYEIPNEINQMEQKLSEILNMTLISDKNNNEDEKKNLIFNQNSKK